MNIGDHVVLHSYKHDGTLHRVWKTEVVLHEDDEVIIVANKRTRVVEDNGRFWYTKEPSVSFLFKHHWFNVIGIIKRNHISYYCNLSSPIYVDDEALKYIDYDLDIKVSGNHEYHVLDMNEFNRNQATMQYPEKVKQILFSEMNALKELIDHLEIPFKEGYVNEWYHKLLSIEGE